MVPQILFTGEGDIHDSAVKCVSVSQRRAERITNDVLGAPGRLREEDVVEQWYKGRGRVRERDNV